MSRRGNAWSTLVRLKRDTTTSTKGADRSTCHLLEKVTQPGHLAMAETFCDIAREYIDFINRQVGVYMDAMAGFENMKVKIERQVHRINCPSSRRIGPDGVPVIVYSSYEDPSYPDIIHSQIVKAGDYISANSRGGSNERQHSQGIIVFMAAYWEHTIRPRLAQARGVELNDIKSDIMGDITIVRNAILHSKGIMSEKEYRRLRVLSNIFARNEPAFPQYDEMHRIFYLVKQDVARLLLASLDIKDAPFSLDDVRDVAIQRVGQ